MEVLMPAKILAQIAEGRSGFPPRTVLGAAAIYIYRAFCDVENLRAYVHLVDSLGLRAVAERYRAARTAGGGLSEEKRRFHAFRQDLRPPGFHLPNQPIIALRVERRAICVAVFLGTQLHYTQVHALPGGSDAAETSAAGFVRWCLAHFADGLLAIEARGERASTRSRELSRHVVRVARESGAAVWEVRPAELFGLLDEPPARTRASFRDSVAGIWPSVAQEDHRRALLDAVGTGLLVTIKRIFGDTEPDGAGS